MPKTLWVTLHPHLVLDPKVPGISLKITKFSNGQLCEDPVEDRRAAHTWCLPLVRCSTGNSNWEEIDVRVIDQEARRGRKGRQKHFGRRLNGIFNALITFKLKAMALDESSARAANLALGMCAWGLSHQVQD